MSFKISNITLNTKASTEEAKNKAKEAEVRKNDATETIEESWVRILAMKNTANDLVKLRAVKNAMTEGIIGREQPGVDKNGKPKKQGKFSKTEAMRLYVVLAESMREQKLSDMVRDTPKNYELVLDYATLKKVVGMGLYEEVIAVDTETTGLDVYVDVIVGISFTYPSRDRHYYIPIKPTTDERALDPERVFEIIRPLIETDSVGKVLHNALFDMAMFRRHGLTMKGLHWDTQTAMYLLNENEAAHGGSFRLKDLAPKYLGVEGDTFSELFGKNAQFAEVPLDIALVYAAKDTHLTWDFYVFQKAHMMKMPEVYKYYTEVEVPLLYVILDMEDNGYVLDLVFAKAYGEQLRAEAKDLHARLMALLAPHYEGDIEELNLNSGPQLKPVLSAAIGKELPNLDAKKTLKPLRKDHEVIDVLMSYRKISKLSGTYIDKLPTKQHPVTKRWHSRFNTGGTVTGRFSSGKDKEAETESETVFNVQNQPEEAREMFLSPPGKVLVGADFKAQEIRCVAHLSQERTLIDAFKKGIDPYATLAAKFHNRPYEEVFKNPDGSDTKERKEMKFGMLATIYGTGKYTLAEQLGTTPDKAQDFLDGMLNSLPDLKAWIEETQKFATRNGYVWMDGKKRKRRLPDAKLKKKDIPYGKYWDDKYEDRRKHNARIGRASRQGPNARVQGSSAIQTKVTMIEAHKLCLTKPGWKLWGTIHDELIFEVPEDVTQEEVKLIEDVMLYSYVFGEVENGTDIEISKVWGKGVPAWKWFADKEKQNEEES